MTGRIPGLTPRARRLSYWRAAWRQPADGCDVLRTLATFLILLPGPLAAADSWDDVLPGVSFDEKPLREALNAVAGPELSVILDRRIDPGLPVTIEVAGRRRRAVMREVARAAGSGLDAVPLGGPQSTGYAAAAEDLSLFFGHADLLLKQLRPFGNRPVDSAWDDLETPRGLVTELFEGVGSGVAKETLELVPHDLWAGGQLAGVSFAEAAAVILGQYGLSVRRLRGNRLAVVTFDPRAIMPQQARLGAEEEKNYSRSPRVIPLAERRFRLQARAARVSSVMAKLRSSGVEFEFDADALDASGVDLGTRIDLDVRDADADEFIDALFGPLGLEASYEGVTVALKVVE